MKKSKITESEHETPMDYRNELDISDNERVDLVDEAIWGLMDEVVANGFTEVQAEKKVADTIDKLVKDEIIKPIPEYESPDGVKASWVASELPRIANYLKLNGDII